MGELRQVRREIATVYPFQGDCDPLMKLRARGHAEIGPQCFRDDRMSEPVAAEGLHGFD